MDEEAAEVEGLDPPPPQALDLNRGDFGEEEEEAVAETDSVELSEPKKADNAYTDFTLRRELRKAELLERLKLAKAANKVSNAQEGEDDESQYGDEDPPIDESLDAYADLGCEIISEEEADDLISRYCKRMNTIGGGANATGKV